MVAASAEAAIRPARHRLDWERDGRDWPHRDKSRFVVASGLRWHVQVWGEGPPALLVHGTAAASHSWRHLAPLLASRFRLCIPDLPGHGFSEPVASYRQSLPATSRALEELLEALDIDPVLAIGHSAGAAILARMCLDGNLAPRALVSINGVMLPLEDFPHHVFAPLARVLAQSALVPRIVAWRAGARGVVERLLADTGSELEPAGVELYRRIASNSGHVAAALAMVAGWDLEALAAELPSLAVPLLLIAGDRDRTVAPAESDRLAATVAGAELAHIADGGHLVHEECADAVAARVLAFARRTHALDD